MMLIAKLRSKWKIVSMIRMLVNLPTKKRVLGVKEVPGMVLIL